MENNNIIGTNGASLAPPENNVAIGKNYMSSNAFNKKLNHIKKRIKTASNEQNI